MAHYELTDDDQYKRIEELLSGKTGDVGRTGEDNRLLSAVWIPNRPKN